MADAPEANASSPKRPSGDGEPSRSWRRCVATGSPRPASSTDRSMAQASALMSSRFSSRSSRQATVVMDNLGSHKGRAVRAAIRAAKAKLLFLPAYSPDLNPIEQAFAKIKTLLRKADARTIEQTWQTIGALLDCFTPI